MYPNRPADKPVHGRGSDDRRTTGRTSNVVPGHQLGGGELTSGPQEAAEQRAILNSIQQQERAERERIGKERQDREDIAKKEKHDKAVEALNRRKFAMELERKKKLRDGWDNSPSRSRSHQPPPPGAGLDLAQAQERMEEDRSRRVPLSNPKMKKRFEKRPNFTFPNFPTSPETIDVDEDEELQLALQASLDDSQPATADSPEVHNIDDLGVFMNLESDTNYYEDDEELQKALMISAAEPQATTTSTTSSHPISYPSAQPPTPSPTTHSSKPSATTHATSMPSTTSHIPSSRPQNTTPQRVYDVDGDVDMDISEDPELQEALMHSLDTHQNDVHPPAQAQLPDKETSRRTRIFGEDVDAQGSAPARGPSSSTITSRTERTRVYGVDDDDRYGGDSELQDALRLSRQVIDVDQGVDPAADRTRVFGGTVEDYPSPAHQTGPVITSVEDEEVQGGMAEDEDEELQRALMSSLNPNASPAQPRRSAGLPHIAPRAPMRTQPPADPAVANARRLRNEQDRAYQESLAEDREKERKAKEEQELARIQKEEEEQAAKQKEMEEAARRDLRDNAGTMLPPEPKEGQGITIGIRMPNGTRFTRRFNPTDTLKDLRHFIESKANESNLAQEYEITSDFPKRSFHDLPLANTLAESGISGRMLLNLLEK